MNNVTRWTRIALVGLLLSHPSTAGAALAGTLWETVAHRHGLAPHLLYAVALAESGRVRSGRTVSPWPWSLNTPGGSRYFESEAEARTALQTLLARHGPQALDVGLLQVNLHWHGHRVAEPAALLDARINLTVAAEILAQAIRSAPGDLELGIGRYHHWRDEGLARGYGRRVLALVRALAETQVS